MGKTTSNIIKISAVCIAIVAIVAAFVFNSNDQKTVSTNKDDKTSQKQSESKSDNKTANNDSKSNDDDTQSTIVAGSQSGDTTNYTTKTGDYVVPKNNSPVATTASSNTSSSAPVTPAAPTTPTTPTNPTTPTDPTTPTNPTTPTDPTTPTNPTNPTTPVAGNMIANGDVEASTNGAPNGWTSNILTPETSATFAYATEGSNHYLNTSVTALGGTYPGALWHPTSSAVTGGKSYKYTESYRSTGTGEIDVEYTHLVNGVATTEFLTVLGQSSPANNWTTFTANFTVPADATSVTVYHVMNSVGSLDTDNFSLTEYTPVGLGQAMVTLTFDDGWKSIYTGANDLLKNNGLVATLYMLSDPLQNNGNYPDYMTVAEALAMQANGNEIGSHTVHHCDLSGVQTEDPTVCPTPIDVATIDKELADSKTYLESQFGPVTSFATPYGGYNATALTEIQKYYASHRSVETGYNSVDSYNPYNIKVQNILDSTTPAEVQGWIDQAIATKTWLVIVYHEVKADTNAGTEDYSVTPANLATELSYLSQQQTAGNVQVKTIRDALAIMQAAAASQQ